MTFDKTDVAWAAGLFEGEGTCGSYYGTYVSKAGKRYSRKTPQAQLAIGMTDLEPLEKFRDTFGFGAIHGPYEVRGGTKPAYKYYVNKREHVQAILAAIYPWLSPRRRAQVAQTLGGGPSPVQVGSPEEVSLRETSRGGEEVRRALGEAGRGPAVQDNSTHQGE